MNNQTPLQPIIDPGVVQRLRSMIADIIDGPGHLNVDWIVNNRWVAVLEESAAHFDETHAETLSSALQAANHLDCFAVATEPLEEFPLCFRVPTTKEGLLDFSQECSHFNFILVPEDKSFAILCTVYDYFIIGGTPKFVKQAVGGDIDAARAKFKEFASDEWWKDRLLAVTRRY